MHCSFWFVVCPLVGGICWWLDCVVNCALSVVCCSSLAVCCLFVRYSSCFANDALLVVVGCCHRLCSFLVYVVVVCCCVALLVVACCLMWVVRCESRVAVMWCLLFRNWCLIVAACSLLLSSVAVDGCMMSWCVC